MNLSEKTMQQFDEMCQIVGSIVFALADGGLECRRRHIVQVLRQEMAEKGKWDPDQVMFMAVAIERLETPPSNDYD